MKILASGEQRSIASITFAKRVRSLEGSTESISAGMGNAECKVQTSNEPLHSQRVVLTKDVDQHFHVPKDSVILKVTLEEAILPSAVPQVQHEVTQKANVCVLNIH